MVNPITPDVVYDLVSASAPSLSPDGKRMIFVESWIDNGAAEARSQLQIMELGDGETRAFTSGPKDSFPAFSPNGKILAFLRPDKAGRIQIWLLDTSGGEAYQLTDSPTSISEYAWSPNTAQIAYCSDVDPDQLSDDHDLKKDPRVSVVRRIRYRHDVSRWRGDAHQHIFVVGIADGSLRQMTSGDWDDSSPVWSPDGERIAFLSGRREDRDLFALNEAYVIGLDGGTPEMWSHELYSVCGLGWSPDSARLVVAASDLLEGSATYQSSLYVLDPGRSPHRLTDDLMKPVGAPYPQGLAGLLRWSTDGRIYFLADQQGESFLVSVSVETKEIRSTELNIRHIAGGACQMTSVSFDGNNGKAVVASTSPKSYGDLQLIDVKNGDCSQLTFYNTSYFNEHPPATLRKFSFDRAGFDIQARVWFPPEFDESRKYPLILDIHGGPNGCFYDTFTPVQHILATAGYVVLAVNPRGSSSYGLEFTMAVLGDWGGEDYQDLMMAVDELVDRPYIDESRLGVYGYSYGGFMSSWVVGHTDRFKAAVIGAPCINLSSMYGTSDIGISFGERQWGGLRKDALDKYMERSPLTYASNVTTPVLLMHGEADYRVPIEQGEQFFVTLKRLGKEIEFVRFPDSAHGFVRLGHPKLRVEYLARVLGWFEKHLE